MISKDDSTLEQLLIACKTEPSENLESQDVEFKEYRDIKSLHNCKNLAVEVSALANSQGGVIIVGIKDSSNVENQKWSSQLAGFEKGDTIEIEQRIKGKLEPILDIKAEYLDFESKPYLVIHVPHRTDTLVTTSNGKTCIRDGRSSRPMKPDEIQKAANNLENYDWSEQTLSLDESSLDTQWVNEAYEDYCQRKKFPTLTKPDTAAFLGAIGAIRDGKITKSGLLFLGKSECIKEWLGSYEYRFSWKTRAGELLINDLWEGCIWESIQRSKRHFEKCNTRSTIKYKDEKYEVQLLDEKAFHEAFVNSIVHRDYSKRGTIAVDFDSSQLMITNPGSFYGGVTPENIIYHQPSHRNISLANLMREFELVDRAGMGVTRMGIGSLKYGRQFPRFAQSDDSIEVTMQAESILRGIFVIVNVRGDEYGIIDLILLNSVYKKGVISIREARKRIQYLSNKDTWESLKDSVERIKYIEFCGTKDDVYIRVIPKFNEVFEVRKTFKITKTSVKHVKVYEYLAEYEKASNEDITDLLEHRSSAHTSKFLREAKYVKRSGSGKSSRWSIV